MTQEKLSCAQDTRNIEIEIRGWFVEPGDRPGLLHFQQYGGRVCGACQAGRSGLAGDRRTE